METWIRSGSAKIIITMHIQPGAKKTEIIGTYGDALKVRIAAPPVDGKANAAVLGFLAKQLGLPNSALTLKSGHTSRRKIIEISGISSEEVATRLLP